MLQFCRLELQLITLIEAVQNQHRMMVRHTNNMICSLHANILSADRCIRRSTWMRMFNTLNAEINRICHPMALLGAHPILHISSIRINYQVYSPRLLHTELLQISQLNCVIINIPATFERVVHPAELPWNHLVLACDSSSSPSTACQMLEEYTLSLGCARIWKGKEKRDASS